MNRKRLILLVLFLIFAAAGIFGWRMLRRGFSARSQPSKLEETIARTMRSLATPAGVKELKNPQAASLQNIRHGMEHFADHCATCHANNGSGDTQFGGGMYPKPPDMRAGATQKLTDGEIYFIIQNGIRLTGMPAFGSGRTDDSSTWNLVLFIRHLPKMTPEEEAEMQRLNPKSPAEWKEMQEIDDFLNEETPPSSSRTKRKNHH